jgi:hypothetical protein
LDRFVRPEAMTKSRSQELGGRHCKRHFAGCSSGT